MEGETIANRSPLKVLYILGRGRGGSTILGNVLGELDGFFSAGEVRTLWDPVVVSGGLCACGRPAADCDVWSRVIEGLDPLEPARLQREVVREGNLLKLSRPRAKDRFPALASFARVMADVYRRVADVTGARVIVDSSKRPSYGAFLRSVPGISPRYVHLVRDPRASAHSWKQRRHGSATPGAEVRRRGALDSTLRWDLLNLEAEILRTSASAATFTLLRYEDFVAAPRATVESLARFVDEEVELTPFEDADKVHMGPHHAIAGNPSRERTGLVRIHDPRDWVRDQSRADRWIATAVAAPLLRRYRYPLLVKPRDAGRSERGRT